MNLIIGIAGVVAIGALYVLLPVFAEGYRRLRGPRVVRCPETAQPTEVELDAVRAAAGALLGRSTLRVHECERWKGSAAQRDCEQGCLKDVTVDAAQTHALLMSRDATSAP
jgi:hypothetical protein